MTSVGGDTQLGQTALILFVLLARVIVDDASLVLVEEFLQLLHSLDLGAYFVELFNGIGVDGKEGVCVDS